jgi:inorganic pyrophosphatase
MDNRLKELFAVLFQAHPWHGITARPGETPELVNAFIEIVPTDTVKYELHKPTGHLRLDRPQRFSSFCPMLYGFIPQTYCGERVAARAVERTGAGHEGDGDPLDICVLSEKTIAHGNFLLQARLIGGLRLIDGDQADDKIIAVLHDDVSFGGVHDLEDCPRGVVDRLEHYFLSYKQRPDAPSRKVHIPERYDRTEAIEVLARSSDDYRAKFGAPEARVEELRRLLQA